MDAESNAHVSWCNELKHHGWDVDFTDSIKANAIPGESALHLHAKTATFRYLKKEGYRVKTEVEKNGTQVRADVVAIAQDLDELPFVVELENLPTDDVRDEKLRKYVRGEPYRDMAFVNLDKIDMDCEKMEAQIAEEIGL